MKNFFMEKKSKNGLWALGLLLFLTGISSCKKDNIDLPAETMVFVSNEDAGTISCIDAETGVTLETIDCHSKRSGMMMSHNVQSSPDGKTVWATLVPMVEGAEEEIIVIDAITFRELERIRFEKEIHLAHIVLDPENKFAFATANEGNFVAKIDAKKFKLESTFEMGDEMGPHGLRATSDKLFIANMMNMSLSIMNQSDGLQQVIPLGGMAVQVAVTSNEKYVFISLYDLKQVVRYEILTGDTTQINLPDSSQGPIQLYPTPDNQTILVCDQGDLEGRPSSNLVYFIDVNTSTIRNSVEVGNAAHGVVVSHDGLFAYITNKNDNTVSVIDLVTETLTGTWPVGEKPNGISYWNAGGGMP